MTTHKTPAQLDAAAWLDSSTADPSRHHVLAAVREAYPDAAEMATAFVRVRPSEAWEAFLYGVMIERAITSEPQAHDLTPSEVALAKILAAIVEWPKPAFADGRIADEIWRMYEAMLLTPFLTEDGEPTDKGRTLLDRAKKVGVL